MKSIVYRKGEKVKRMTQTKKRDREVKQKRSKQYQYEPVRKAN